MGRVELENLYKFRGRCRGEGHHYQGQNSFMADPTSLFPDVSVNPISDRNSLTSEEVFCFCCVRVTVATYPVQCNKVGSTESDVLKSSMFTEVTICCIQ